MRSIDLPNLDLGAWYSFEKRHYIQGYKMPGVYVIAVSDFDLGGKRVDWSNVSYIGITVSQDGLCGRWKQFYKAIRGKKGCHSGGYSAFELLGHYDEWKKSLFVAAMPIHCNTTEPSSDDLVKMGWIAFFKYEALSEFRRHCNGCCKPEFNTM